MQDYKTYIEELQTLKIELKEFFITDKGYRTDISPDNNPGLDLPKEKYLWLGHYDQSKSNYKSDLIKLQQRAYSDILVMGKEAALSLHKQLMQAKTRFINLYKKMIEIRAKFREKSLSHIDLEQFVYPNFIVSIEDSKKQGVITQEFMNDFEDALMHKTSNLRGLIKQLEVTLGIDSNMNNTKTDRRIEEPLKEYSLTEIKTSQVSQIDKKQVKDFERELSVVEFGFKKIITNNADFREALFEEFLKLTPKPKLYWYINAFISDEEWAEDRLSNGPPATTSQVPIAANFYAMSALEKEVQGLIQEFNRMLLKNEVEAEYYGRFIKDTNTVKVLDDINDNIIAFKKYVLSDTNVDYPGYAQATCRNIISLTNKIDIPGLKHALLTSFVDDGENMEVIFKYLHETNAESRRRETLDKYHILKSYANSFLRKEINNKHTTQALPRKTKQKELVIKSLQDMFVKPENAEICLNILKEIPNPILDSSNNYIGRGKKGVFPLWIKVLRQFEQGSLVKPLTDAEYKDILNATIPNLNLTSDASEFRKIYPSVERGGYELDMKTILSQFSQSGKLGK